MHTRETIILWADDEIDLLKPHILFLQSKGFKVLTATNGDDALKIASTTEIDLIFLDENMPGKSGLEVLSTLKVLHPGIPVVMVTKSEEEDIMEEAIGSKIDDYLIKPVNPNQMLLSIKKHLDNKRLITQKTTSTYQSEFNSLGMLINNARTYPDWLEIYRKLVYWELELDKSGHDMAEVLKHQKAEANNGFARFIKTNYASWLKPETKEKPLLSPGVMGQRVFPLIEQGNKVVLVLIDNLRYDQWLTLSTAVNDFCKIEKDELYVSILPTATQYSRNALFAGLMPLEIQKMYPHLWVSDEDEEPKNINEEELIRINLDRFKKGLKFCYEKVNNERMAKKLVDNFSNFKNFDLSIIVFNFVDILSHARTETQVVKELALDESAYRSITQSWFKHSSLPDFLKLCTDNDLKVVLTTDHGTIKVTNPVRIIGDRKTSPNLRYKLGRNLNYNPKEVYEVKKPSDIHLPGVNITSSFIFAYGEDFLVYPNNYNQFVNYYRNTFQHGGISMEEMMIPLILLSSK
jgi:DNA-binding response OmpR family regulator